MCLNLSLNIKTEPRDRRLITLIKQKEKKEKKIREKGLVVNYWLLFQINFLFFTCGINNNNNDAIVVLILE